jgi:hypothetical protein
MTVGRKGEGGEEIRRGRKKEKRRQKLMERKECGKRGLWK